MQILNKHDTTDFKKKVPRVYIPLIKTIYLSLTPKVAEGTFFSEILRYVKIYFISFSIK